MLTGAARSKIWHGQEHAPVEASFRDHCACGATRSFYFFPEGQDRQRLVQALEMRLQHLGAAPLQQN